MVLRFVVISQNYLAFQAVIQLLTYSALIYLPIVTFGNSYADATRLAQMDIDDIVKENRIIVRSINYEL